MAAAGTWKGFLKLSFVTCAVRLTPATTAAEHVSFHLINPETGNRVKMKTHDAETDDVLERKDLKRGYEYEKGQYVLLDEDEIKALRIESTRTIDIERFTPLADIDRRYFDTPYYLVPDTKMAVESYRVIQEAIAEEKLVGIAKLVMSNRERVVAIEPRDRGMIVTTLRSPDEMRDFQPLFEEIDDKALDREMVKLAKQLIEKMTGSFDPKMFEDRYQAALHELVQSKIKGVAPHLPEPKQTGQVINLFEALKKSVESAGGESRGREKPRRAHEAPAAKGRRKSSKVRRAG
ncbi:MAG: Ku protein [Gemmatimonas sp.]